MESNSLSLSSWFILYLLEAARCRRRRARSQLWYSLVSLNETNPFTHRKRYHPLPVVSIVDELPVHTARVSSLSRPALRVIAGGALGSFPTLSRNAVNQPGTPSQRRGGICGPESSARRRSPLARPHIQLDRALQRADY
jgi:hypothetical protein